ncbi:competence protein ComEC family protein [Chryseobacterium sp. SSA4.19]|uniref:ComEC/Rec2 family competence protein n=1 Tax=Chryseobacterium sp. SSA4.19 TaxID=2919915 RepID=UPI001F4E5556|nr:ComEC/Rec2 family competence protein [Chryseobacterium sp. SSA4.19]MCJ8153549.1 competence protein ComEC family protein [Chryseobacterium sp. SSA4.19]
MKLNKQPLLILVICFILGIFFQDYFSFGEYSVFLLIGFCTVVLIATFLTPYVFHKAKPYVLGCMFFGIGIILHFFNASYSKNISFSKNETIVFRISKKLNSNEKNRKYEAVAQIGEEHFNTILYVPRNERLLDFNHYYKTRAYVSSPKPPKYDFQFDYTKYLKRKNIYYQCYVNDVILSAGRSDLNLNEKFSQKRAEVLQDIDKTEISPVSREFLKGIILADRTDIDAQTVQDFNRSGLVHFLAISGTHIVVIFGLFYLVLMKFLPLKFRKYAIVSSLAFIWLFTIFIGFGSSVVRSSIMLTVYFIYVLLQRKPDLLHSLSLSAFIILIADTQQIFDVGFQLSFLAVLGIFWLNQPILNHLPKQNNWFKKILFNTISISVSAQLVTLPLVLYYFHQFSLISVVANFFIVPFSEIIIVMSFIMTALIAFKIDFYVINVIYDYAIQILLKIIHWFAGFETVFFENISMSLSEVFFLFIIIYLTRFAVLKFNFRNSARLMMALFIFLILRVSLNIYENQKTEILVHEFSKSNILSLKKGDKACFWIKEDVDQNKVIRFIVNPYCSSRRLNDFEIRHFPGTVREVIYNGKTYSIR